MGTVSKALSLLDVLKDPKLRLGLTEIARLSSFDKATTRRLLVELMANGFVEQDSLNKHYVLGPTLQMLGKAREERFPLYKTLLPIVRGLAEATGETAHATEYGAGQLISVCTQESDKANRVSLEVGQKLPLHATASGIAFLSSCLPAFIESMLRKPRTKFTATTPVKEEQLLALVAEARARGYSVSNQSMEDGVHSVAASFLDDRGQPIGAIAVAMPSSRASASIIAKHGKLAAAAAREITLRLYGKPQVVRRVI